MNSEEARGRVETAALDLADTVRALRAIPLPAPTPEEAAMRRMLSRRRTQRKHALMVEARLYAESLVREALEE